MSHASFRFTSYFAATLAVLTLAACSGAGSSSGGGTTTNPPPPTTSPYTATSVLLLTNTAIYTYPLSGDGTPTTINVTPSSTLTAPSGTLFTAMAQDTAGNLYVSAYQTSSVFSQEILVYPTGSSGTATPTRTITGDATLLSTQNLLSLPKDQLYGILALAVDSTGQIYATLGPAIYVFSATANGNVAPTRTISGTATGITYATTLAVDSANNLLTTNIDTSFLTGEVLDFSSTANGNVAPTHTYAGAEMSFPFGLDLDSNNNVFVSDTSGGGKIYAYSSTASAPARTFTTDAPNTTGSYESFWGLRQDKSGYTFVAAELNSGMTGIQVFSPTATGVTTCVTFATTVPFVRSPQILLR